MGREYFEVLETLMGADCVHHDPTNGAPGEAHPGDLVSYGPASFHGPGEHLAAGRLRGPLSGDDLEAHLRRAKVRRISREQGLEEMQIAERLGLDRATVAQDLGQAVDPNRVMDVMRRTGAGEVGRATVVAELARHLQPHLAERVVDEALHQLVGEGKLYGFGEHAERTFALADPSEAA